ncbi:MAG: DMT family transporter [Roseobacter sp.]
MDIIHQDLWIFLSFAAAAFQTLRFMLQKVVSTATLSPTGATFARFCYSAPIIAVLLVLYVQMTSASLDMPEGKFWGFALTGALAQVLATICVVTLFKMRSFAVGVTLMKTEVLLSVATGMILLGEGVSLQAFVAILIGLIGVLMLSTPPEIQNARLSDMWNRGVALGLTSGLLFSISAVSYRGASLQIDAQDPILRAGVTLSVVTGSQMVGMALWLWLRDRPQLKAVWHARRVAAWIGLMSLAGSFCWFFAFTLQNAAYVKAVGQVELIFSLLVSIFFFGEKSSRRELLGMAVLTISILALI